MLASKDPVVGLPRLPVPTRNDRRYVSPVETFTSCMFSLSVGVYQRKFGGLAEFAAAMRLEAVTDEDAKTLLLPVVSVNAVKGK